MSHRRRVLTAAPTCWFAAILAVALGAPAAWAQPLGPDAARPIGGCGKARALAARYLAETYREAFPGSAATPRDLPEDTDVLSCFLDIELTNINTGAGTCTITGSNTLTVQVVAPSIDDFTLRLRTQFTITSALVNGNPVSVSTTSTTTRLVTLDRSYNEGEIFVLKINYTGTSASRGFGSIDVGTQGGTPIVESLSEPYYAYTWWPCKDGDVGVPGDNSDKFTMQMWVTVPGTYVVPSNGLLQGVDSLSGSRKRYRWASDYPISTYLVCFAATNYNHWTQTYSYPGGTMPVEFYIYPGNDSPANRAAWENCLNMIATYRPVYGEYPFINEKYGIYNFNFGGGMEHQTMTGEGTFDESVTAHELGHQWWGDMITCRTWSDIWLNEGFATFTECIWAERKTGTPILANYLSAMVARKPPSVGGTVYVTNTSDPNIIFDYTNSYEKGAWVLHMLRGAVGDTTFFDILADYRNAFEFSAATTDDFAAVASSTSGQDLTTFFNQWVIQPGAPAYQYGWQSVSVAGQNYLLVRIAQTHTTAGYPSVFVMPVKLRATIGGSPTTYTVQNDARTEWFVLPVPGTVTALAFDPDQWILRTAATSAAYSPGPPKIVAASPAPGASLPDSPAVNQITVTFHTNVNAAAANFSIVGDSSGARAFTLASGSNVNPAVLNLAAPLPPDNYTLTVTSGVTAVNSGMSLDGEIADPNSPASLPSGDGVAGGNAVLRFAVVPSAGDINQDGHIDATDLELLVEVLLGIDTIPQHVSRSDINGNGSPEGGDIQAFVNIYPGF